MICNLCPRNCNVERGKGFCGMGENPVLARAALHYWEEPCISGDRGSGAVFFSGCSLNCAFCQNYDISTKRFGKEISIERLQEIYMNLQVQGAHNINLVNPTHFIQPIVKSLDISLNIPVVYNSGGYDKIESLKMLDGKIQIYLPDLKYLSDDLGKKYSMAPNYPETAKTAIMEMFRQVGPYKLNEDGIMEKGVIIRHLILPNNIENTFKVIDWIAETFNEGEVLVSLMSQFTPMKNSTEKFPELNRRLNQKEYDLCMDYLEKSGISEGFFQELSSAEEEYIPDFDLEGV